MFLFLLLVAIVLSSVSAIAVTPSVSNATGDYYLIEDSTSSQSNNKVFTCPASKGCYIHCKWATSCKWANILSNSGGSPTWLYLECSGGDACDLLVSLVNPTVSADIICSSSSGGACNDAQFTLANTPTVNVLCDNGEFTATNSLGAACGDMELRATNAEDFTLGCLDDYDCSHAVITVSATLAVITAPAKAALEYATINGADSGRLEVSCTGVSTCVNTEISPPHESEYVFKLECGYSAGQCNAVKVNVPSKSVYVENYMELICPPTNFASYLCRIYFCCQDTGQCQTITEWTSSNTRYECDDQLCCPWTDAENMSQPPTERPTASPSPAPTVSPTTPTSTPTGAPTSPTIPPTPLPTAAPTGDTSSPTKNPTLSPTSSTTSPTFAPTSAPTDVPTLQPTGAPTEKYIAGSAWPGYELFIRGFNIWTLEISGNIILDINRIDANVEGYSTEGGSCSLSSLEFDSSFSSYQAYAESDALAVEGGFSAGAGGAGGAYSEERSESKSNSASAQTYIYTMDLKCEVASASTNALNNLYFSAAFVNRLRILPDSYTDGDDLSSFESFWDSYGTHFIRSAKLGGTVRGAMTASKCSVESSYSSSDSFEVCLNAEYKGAEGAGCYGESASSGSGLSIESSITNTQVTVRGGATSTFTDTFNSFGDKTNDFQAWIDTLDDEPDIVGGDLQPTHEALIDALDLGSHRLNDASDADLSDDEWRAILVALGNAYEYKSASIEAEDAAFDAGKCTLTCAEGALILESCTCTDCSSANKCCTPDNDAASSDGDADPASVSGAGKLAAQILIPAVIVCVCFLCIVRYLYKRNKE